MAFRTPSIEDSPSIIFQSAKLGDLQLIAEELGWAQSLLDDGKAPSKVYGISGGALAALTYSLSPAARYDQQNWGKAVDLISVFSSFLGTASSGKIRSLNRDPPWGIYNLNPLSQRS
jgi:hypothetical protein